MKKYIQKIKKITADLSNRHNAIITSNQKVVSFTFDDVPLTGITNGLEILNDHSKKGTFYFSLSFLQGNDGNENLYSSKELLNVINQGHEVGCHTYSHLHFYNNISKSDIGEDLKKNQTAINKIAPDTLLENFSYPYGEQTIRAKSIVSQFYKTSRSNDYGINVGRIDLNNLKSIRLYENDFSLNHIYRILEDFAQTGGWLIFYTHDIQDDFSKYGCSKNYFNCVIAKCLELKLDVYNIKETMKLLDLN